MSEEEELDIWGSKERDGTSLQAARAIRIADPLLHRRRRARPDLRYAEPLALRRRAGEVDVDGALDGRVVIAAGFGELLIRARNGGRQTEGRVARRFLAARLRLRGLLLVVMGFPRFPHRAPPLHYPPALRRHGQTREAKTQ